MESETGRVIIWDSEKRPVGSPFRPLLFPENPARAYNSLMIEWLHYWEKHLLSRVRQL
jgi:hypothetical protein